MGKHLMPWFKVDDKIHSHPKARRAGLAAMGLWSLAGSHCMDYLTDGVVERWFVESWANGEELAERLVLVGLWDEHPEGWQFHDWGEYQPTREKVLSERAATKERVEKHRAKRGSNGVTSTVGTTTPSPVPSPDFYSPSKSQSLDTRARVSTDAIQVSEMTRRLAAQNGITSLRTVVDAVGRIGIRVTADQAFQLASILLNKAKTWPASPQPYVLACIRETPAEIEKTLYEQVGVA
jgi:hypothetical protein